MIVAIAHVLGAIVAVVAFGFVVLAFATWEQERNRRAAVQEASIVLGIPEGELEQPAHVANLIRFAADRFSSELFRNRFSDFCGFVSTVWGWIGNIVQLLVLAGVILNSFSDPRIAVNAWWIVPIGVLFWITSVLFALACRLLTGRYPGQARQARKVLLQVVKSKATPSFENAGEIDPA